MSPPKTRARKEHFDPEGHGRRKANVKPEAFVSVVDAKGEQIAQKPQFKRVNPETGEVSWRDDMRDPAKPDRRSEEDRRREESGIHNRDDFVSVGFNRWHKPRLDSPLPMRVTTTKHYRNNEYAGTSLEFPERRRVPRGRRASDPKPKTKK